MLVQSQVVAAGSGSMGGLTWSHNRGGQYVRSRVVPTNPRTSFQDTVRNTMSYLAAYWRDILTEAQRAGWATYAANVPVVNRLGATIFLTGQNMFIRSNAPRISNTAGTINTLIATAPSIFNLGEVGQTALTNVDASSNNASINFDANDDWVSEDGAAMFVYLSRPLDPSINFFKGPYRLAGEILGDSTPPTPPGTVTLPFPVVAGQRVFARVRVTRADGRLSVDQFLYSAVSA